MEVLIAITLLSLLSVGMVIAMRVGLAAFGKTNNRLMDNRRVAGTQDVLQQELEGLMPVVCQCGIGPGAAGKRMGFFEGGRDTMRLVSSFSLQQAWRGQPQILELLVIPGEEGHGVRLVVNEIPYTGPPSAGRLCIGIGPDPMSQMPVPRFVPAEADPHSFVLADKLAYCRFSYFSQGTPAMPPAWRAQWPFPGWPAGIRVEMAPLEADPGRVQPIAVTAVMHVWRAPDIDYVD
jgi:hypothetical protein